MADEIFLGLMSGTSLDAIDAVAVCFDDGLRLLGTHSLVLSDEVRERILAITLPGENEIDRMGQLDRELGYLFAECASHLIDRHRIARQDIRAIGCHGQTIRHRPGLPFPFTLQIGDPSTIADRTGLAVICDFRRKDIAAGGQGAPLVPAFHEAMFRSPTVDRTILNLGGIANITLLPASPSNNLRGYDTGPANMLLDGWVQRHRQTGYDKDGCWAQSGQSRPELLARLRSHPFFRHTPPKSTGREDFNLNWLDQNLALLSPFDPADVQATLAELTATTVADAIRTEGMDHGELWVCGGGALNTDMLRRLALHLPDMNVASTDNLGLAPVWVEATAFAWLAYRTWHRLPGNAPAVTGAEGARVLGGIYWPD